MIEVDEQREGLYYFQRMSAAAAMQTGGGNMFDLWHKRLGYLSSKVIELVPNVDFGRSSILCDRTCDVCLRAKYTREISPLSNNKSLERDAFLSDILLRKRDGECLCGIRQFSGVV